MRDRISSLNAAVSTPRILNSPFVFLAAWVLLPIVLSVIIISQFDSLYRSVYGYACVIGLVAVSLLVYGWESIRSSIRIEPDRWRLHWCWALVGLAIVLRYILLQYLPPPHPIIEEIQTGGIAVRIIQNAELPLDFRFTNWLAALGLWISIGDSPLDSLRTLFHVAGALSILFVALTLRHISVGWPATLLAVFTMASLRFLVIGGNTAEEIFGGILFEILLFYFVIRSHTSRDNKIVWAGFAGMTAGVLMFEYIPYKWPIVVPVVWWFSQAVFTKDTRVRLSVLRLGSVYILCLTLICAPVISDFAHNREESYLIETIVRHSDDGHPLPVTDMSELKRSVGKMWRYTQVLIGQNEPFSSSWYKAGDSVIVPLVGLIFGLSFIQVLWRPRIWFFRIAALMVLLTVVGQGLTTNNFNVGILIPTVVFLILLTGLAADEVVQWLRSIRSYESIVATVSILTIAFVALNIVSIVRMASNPISLAEYSNNQYSVCQAIAEESMQYEYVYIYTLGGRCTYNDELWMYPDITAPIENHDRFPVVTEVMPGALVVFGRSYGLPDEQMKMFIALAVNMDSAHTLRTTHNLLGKTAAVSFCYECVPSSKPQ